MIRLSSPVFSFVFLTGILSFSLLRTNTSTFISFFSKQNATHKRGTQNTKLKTDRRIITTLINIAPLLGLLGTVGGMVNSFAALSGTITIAQTSVAAGISEALVSTQLGLLVAIPALCINILLNRKEEVLALAIKEELGDKKGIAGSLNNIGNIPYFIIVCYSFREKLLILYTVKFMIWEKVFKSET